MDRIYYITLLMDFYGDLLTEKQRQVMSGYYFDDCSLSEIAHEHSITKQSVQDMIKRSENTLNEYESSLMLVEKYLSRKKIKEEILQELDSLDCDDKEKIGHIKNLLDQIAD